MPKDNLLRKIKENIDFSFVNPMLREQYCENYGRPATEPEMRGMDVEYNLSDDGSPNFPYYDANDLIDRKKAWWEYKNEKELESVLTELTDISINKGIKCLDLMSTPKIIPSYK